MRDPRKRKLFSTIYLFLVSCCIMALVLPSFAWFFRPQTDFDTSFDASIVKSYFDAESEIDETDPSKSTFFITKPVHLYNLAYLTDKGVFKQATNFQFGKQRKNADGTLIDANDTTYYVYKDNYADETLTKELNNRTIDMNVYDSEGGIPPIGVGLKTGAELGYDTFYHTLTGNGITIANCRIKDSIGSEYFDKVGLFGVLGDGAAVKNFKLLNLTVTTSENNPSQTVNCGLVAGYLDQTDTGKITVENIGIANGDFHTKSKIYSKFSFIGSGTTKGIETANNFFTKDANSGDTGIVNMDGIVNMIRAAKDENGKNINDTNTNDGYFIINGYDKNNLFDGYVLKRNSDGVPVARYNRCVDFRGQQVILGNKRNGIGVFDLVTPNQDTDTDFKTGLDQFSFKALNYNDTQAYTKFYYSTAEIYSADQNFNSIYGNNEGGSNWIPEYYSGSTSPAHYDASLQSSQVLFYEASFNGTAEKNYFSDTKYTYLRELFEKTLVDKDGNAVTAGTKDFGVAAKYVDTDATIKNVTSMHHILKLSRFAKSGVNVYDVDSYEVNGETWIASSVYFTLTREANVTVFASSKDVSGGDSRVSIYSHEKTMANKGIVTNPMRNPMYVMWVPQSDTRISYFPENGDDTTAAVWEAGKEETKNGITTIKGVEKLYAHTFKLPAGRYFLNVPDRVVSLMHISVQGQEGGDMGDIGKDGFSIDFVTDEESINSDFMVGGEGYVYSQTAFTVELQDAVAFQVCFLRIKNTTEKTDVVYAYVTDASQINFLQYVNEGYGVITATNPVV